MTSDEQRIKEAWRLQAIHWEKEAHTLLGELQARTAHIDELLVANNKLVESERSARHGMEQVQRDYVTLAKELASKVRELHAAQGELEKLHAVLLNSAPVPRLGDSRHPDRDTTGGFDVCCDQPKRAIRASAFDVGLGRFTIGDRCWALDDGTIGQGVIYDVLHDGEAEVHYLHTPLGMSSNALLKWGQIFRTRAEAEAAQANGAYAGGTRRCFP